MYANNKNNLILLTNTFLLVYSQIVESTSVIVLNSLELDILRVSVTPSSDGAPRTTTSITYSEEQETVSLAFDEKLPADSTAVLDIEFRGELNNKMKGFYSSKYLTADGKERFAGVTQFEATDARRCFPCWDEPAIKATFVIVLNVPADLMALSNMPVVADEKFVSDGGQKMKRMKFDVTPIMSTYLVAVVVGEYDYVEQRSEDGVLVRVYTPLGKAEQGRFALEVATKVLPYYRDYFGIAYPLPKMDLIAISDFSGGAMENWGLITYRETFLLVDPENTSLIRKQSIALTVGHEIAHQWFGNLVTMEWWTHLWLNEGYASFTEFLCVDHIFPEYDIWTQFLTDMYTRALELDGLKNSHPIEVAVGHPSEIDEIFDEISYNKGASVIRMLHDWIGEEDFKKGMGLYLKKFQYRNTETEDLWHALEESSNKKVGAVMSTWIKQKGFPIVSVTQRQDGADRILTVSQTKFKGVNEDPEKDQYMWMIPLTFASSADPKKIILTHVLEGETAEIRLPNLSAAHWVKVNPGTVGYYRVNYSPEMLEALLPSISDLSLPPLDRLGLMDDLFAMAQGGHASTVEVFKLMDAYRNEDNYTVWSSISCCLGKLQLLLSHTELEAAFKAYGVRLFKPISDKLGWTAKPGESHLDTLLRSLVLSRLVSFDCKDVQAVATQKFQDHVKGKTTIPADLRAACYKSACQDADRETFALMLELYRATDLSEEKDRVSRSLGAIRNVDLLREVIDFALSVNTKLLKRSQNILLTFYLIPERSKSPRRSFHHNSSSDEQSWPPNGVAVFQRQLEETTGSVFRKCDGQVS